MTNWKKELAVALLVRKRLASVSGTLWPFDVPRPPATERDLVEAEHRLGSTLDPEYREFLKIADGWPAFYKDTDLLGSAELGKGAAWALASELLSVEPVRSDDGGEFERSALIPIAVAKSSMDIFCLTRAESDGPGRVVWVGDGAVVEVFPNFAEFFLSMVDYAREAVMRFEKGTSLS